jgi:hypothetical protein
VARREVRGGRSQWAESTTASSVNFAASIWVPGNLGTGGFRRHCGWHLHRGEQLGGLRGQGGRWDPTEGMVAILVRIFY